jgi:predicted ATPase/DNA-binding SARP family transcriptional activator
MDELWRIELLGRLQVTGRDRVVSRFRRQKEGVLLAYLAYYPHRSHPREGLIEMLWPERDLDAARRDLRVALTSLRRLLEPLGVPSGAVIRADRATVQMNPQAIATDVASFEAALKSAGRAPDAAERKRRLMDAVELYGGDLLPAHYEDWIFPERQRLLEAYLQALQQLGHLSEQEGDLRRAIQWGRRAVSADPLREEGRRDLIRLLAALGEGEAVRRETQALHQLSAGELDALSDRSPCRPRDSGKAASLTGWRSRPLAVGSEKLAYRGGPLPPSFTPFFGREAETARLQQMLLGQAVGITRSAGTRPSAEGEENGALTDSRPPATGSPRLITLTGPGGCGKSRLALEVARQVSKRCEGAVWFVPLANVSSPQLIFEQLAAALPLPDLPYGQPFEAVTATLAHQPSLLLLDNFEHLIDGGATIVASLLARVETLRVVATSRRRLDLPGEREFPVPMLPVPDGSESPECLMASASVQIFVDRAQGARPDFQLTRHNAAAVAELCRQLEGLPLALELAAGRSAVLTPQKMLDLLKDRFTLLVTRRQMTDPRHGSLRAVLDWSYHLLSPDLRRFLAQLSIFRGGWTLDAAAAVSGEPDVLDRLERLQACSLIIAEEPPVACSERAISAGGLRQSSPDRLPVPVGMRYRMLETVRAYAAEQLPPEEQAPLAQRHLAYYRALAEAAESELSGPEQSECLQRLASEQDNMRAALAASRTEGGDSEGGLRLAGSLWPFWGTCGYAKEGYSHLAAALEANRAAPSRSRARALRGAGTLAHTLGDLSRAQSCYEESFSLYREMGDTKALAGVLGEIGFTAVCQADYIRAGALLRESLHLSRQVGDDHGVAAALHDLGELARVQARFDRATLLVEKSLTLSHRSGDDAALARGLITLGNILVVLGEYRRAHLLLREALGIARALQAPGRLADALRNEALMAMRTHRYDQARALYDESLCLYQELELRGGIADVKAQLAELIRREGGPPERVAELYKEALALFWEVGSKPGVITHLEVLARVACEQEQWEVAARLLKAARKGEEALHFSRRTFQGGGGPGLIASANRVPPEVTATTAWTAERSMMLEHAVRYALQAT